MANLTQVHPHGGRSARGGDVVPGVSADSVRPPGHPLLPVAGEAYRVLPSFTEFFFIVVDSMGFL